MTTRIDHRFAELKAQGRAALVTFLTAGDPDPDTSLAILRALPAAGADVIELGMPFTDPMADGPAIQMSSQRALKAGQTLTRTLGMVRAFRQADAATPIVLMGYYNPIYIYGVDRFLADAKSAGVDGLIVVDLPPEEDAELCLPALAAGLNFIRLATPTTDDKRLPAVLANTSGFVYYVSITGITGSAAPDAAKVSAAVARIKRHTALPVAVGFGVRTAEQAAAIAAGADGVVVGSALVGALKDSLDRDDKATAKTVTVVVNLVAALARGVRGQAQTSLRSPRRLDCPRTSLRSLRKPTAGRQVDAVIAGADPAIHIGGAKAVAMNWISNVVRPKIRNYFSRRETPENLWIKCPETGQLVFYKDVEANQFVIPGSNYHMRMGAMARLKSIFDNETWFDIAIPEVPLDPLKFRDERRYTDRLKDARAKTGTNDAIKLGYGKLDGLPAVIGVQDFDFMGGSLGMAAGEAVIKGLETAVDKGTPFIMFAASGGARMQEGILSLMQLPRTTVAVQMLREARRPYIVVLTNPTTGGVTASYAMLGDVHIAEPGALIGFAGPRVIEQTIREKLPDGFQRSEYLKEHGMVDMVVHRRELRATLANLCRLLTKAGPTPPADDLAVPASVAAFRSRPIPKPSALAARSGHSQPPDHIVIPPKQPIQYRRGSGKARVVRGRGPLA